MNIVKRILGIGLCAILGSTTMFAIEQSDVNLEKVEASKCFKYNEYGKTWYLRHSLNMDWPKSVEGVANIKGLQAAVIEGIFNKAYPSLDDAMESLNQCEKTGSTLVDSIPGDAPKNDIVIENGTVEFKGCNKEVVCFSITSYSQQAGAVGQAFTSFLNYDVQTGKTFEYTNTFVPKSKFKVVNVIKKALMKREGLATDQALEDAGWDFTMVTDGNAVPGNFYFKGNDICFVFHPYEITAETTDEVTIEVPASDFGALLTPAAKTAIGL